MKTFSFIVPLILSILCLLYLLFYPCHSTTLEHNFSAKVLAKENDNNTISKALFLATDSFYQEKIEAHEKCYYYVSTQKDITFSINSRGIQHLKAELLSPTGKYIPYHVEKKKNTLLLTPSCKKTSNTERIFFCLANQSVSGYTVQIQIATTVTATPKPNKSTASNPKTAAPKQDKSTASNPKTAAPKQDKPTASNPKTVTPKQDKPTASNPKTAVPKQGKPTASNPKTVPSKSDKTVTIQYKEAFLQPQFLLLQPNSSRKIVIANYTRKNAANRFIWLSTNPNTATVKKGIITTHQEGTAIIYLRDKKNVNNTSSCLIRVIGKENKID